jgi:hypothetical protein
VPVRGLDAGLIFRSPLGVSRLSALSTGVRQGTLTTSTRQRVGDGTATLFKAGAPPRWFLDEEDFVAETYNGYCVKCKEKRDFQGEVAVSKTGMKMAKGTCPVCGTTVNRILGKA